MSRQDTPTAQKASSILGWITSGVLQFWAFSTGRVMIKMQLVQWRGINEEHTPHRERFLAQKCEGFGGI